MVQSEESNEFVSEFYQKKLASKDREIEDLTQRVRKLLLKEVFPAPFLCVFVCRCVRERERERMCVCVCV